LTQRVRQQGYFFGSYPSIAVFEILGGFGYITFGGMGERKVDAN